MLRNYLYDVFHLSHDVSSQYSYLGHVGSPIFDSDGGFVIIKVATVEIEELQQQKAEIRIRRFHVATGVKLKDRTWWIREEVVVELCILE